MYWNTFLPAEVNGFCSPQLLSWLKHGANLRNKIAFLRLICSHLHPTTKGIQESSDLFFEDKLLKALSKIIRTTLKSLRSLSTSEILLKVTSEGSNKNINIFAAEDMINRFFLSQLYGDLRALEVMKVEVQFLERSLYELQTLTAASLQTLLLHEKRDPFRNQAQDRLQFVRETIATLTNLPQNDLSDPTTSSKRYWVPAIKLDESY